MQWFSTESLYVRATVLVISWAVLVIRSYVRGAVLDLIVLSCAVLVIVARFALSVERLSL